MLNIEKYKDEIIEIYQDNEDVMLDDSIAKVRYKYTHDGCLHTVALINWLCEEYKEPLLEDFEITLIKSFLDIVTFETVYKRGDELDLENEVGTIATIKMEGMFENLEDHTKYTLEELGIWQ